MLAIVRGLTAPRAIMRGIFYEARPPEPCVVNLLAFSSRRVVTPSRSTYLRIDLHIVRVQKLLLHVACCMPSVFCLLCLLRWFCSFCCRFACSAVALMLFCCCFAVSLLLLCCCFAVALLLLCYCFAAALLVP